MGEPSPNSPEFEPTAEMMVNDFDDERTLDEEEALEEAEEQHNELSDLEKEKDMPIEALLAMYSGYNEEEGDDDEEDDDDGGQDGSSGSEEIVTNQDINTEKGPMDQVDVPEKQKADDEIQPATEPPDAIEMEDCEEEEKEPPSLLHQLYKDDPSVMGSRHLRSGSRQHSEEEEDEDEDCDYNGGGSTTEPEEEDWKKTIMVGSDYQAAIPDGTGCKYDDAMPYENEDKLLWDPSTIPESDVREYLSEVQDIQTLIIQGVESIPRGSHVRDDEQALYLLLQCGHNKEEAIRRQKINSVSSADSMSLWSEEECRNFETGLRQYGKDFHSIQQNRVRTRSVSELVQFYYLWKKTERHDVFANKARLEKKKYTLHPGTTDFMERFLDEQDSPVSSPGVHSLLSGDPKRQTRTPPPNFTDPSELVTPHEAHLISSHYEEIARHLDKESLESLVKLASGAKHPNGVSSASDSLNRSSTTFISPSETLVTHSNQIPSNVQ